MIETKLGVAVLKIGKKLKDISIFIKKNILIKKMIPFENSDR